jgi:DNA-directed RNA polymerase specialized sigma24 family protein
MEIDEHLFRREAGRMVATLTRVFGVHNLALAEDVTQDAFCRALEVWKFRGVPENPSAWLMTTAKNRALDVLRRERTARTFGPELGRLLESKWTLAPVVEEQFGDQKPIHIASREQPVRECSDDDPVGESICSYLHPMSTVLSCKSAGAATARVPSHEMPMSRRSSCRRDGG